MLNRSRLACPSCHRPVPRAAARCPWCASPVDPVRQGPTTPLFHCLSGDAGAAHPPLAMPTRSHADRS